MTAYAHGMKCHEVPAHWPALSVSELAPVLAAYPAAGDVRAIEWHSHRPFAASGIVDCSCGRVFVKRHDHRVRSVSDLREEHCFIEHLLQRGAPVAAVLTGSDGETAVAGPVGVYEVHAVGIGKDRYRDTPSWTPVRQTAEAFAAGKALARLHNAASGYSAPIRRTRCLVAGDFIARASDPLDAVAAWVGEDSWLAGALTGRRWREDFRRVLRPLYAALQPCLPALTPAWVHGDFHASNLLWQGSDVTAVLDFGLSNRASALFDLATAIERNAIAWLTMTPGNTSIGFSDLACALIEGYASVRMLPSDERRVLRHLLPVVHVEFALSELCYFHGITGSAEDAELAYSTFLFGHAAWFRSTDGVEFLDRIAG